MDENNNNDNLQKIRALGEKVRQGGGLTTTCLIDYTSTRGEVYQGTVEFKRATMGDYLKMGAVKAKLLKQGDPNVDVNFIDEDIKYVAEAVSALTVVTVACPDWLLKPAEILDFDLLMHVYGKYQEWVSTFRIGESN